jgi:hypothetical protein
MSSDLNKEDLQEIINLLIQKLDSFKDEDKELFTSYLINNDKLIADPILSNYLTVTGIDYIKNPKGGILISTPEEINHGCAIACMSWTPHLIWLDRELISNENTAISTFMHEVGHFVMRAVFNNDSLPYFEHDIIAKQAYFEAVVKVLEIIWTEKNWNNKIIDEIKKAGELTKELGNMLEGSIPNNHISTFDNSLLTTSDSILFKIETGQYLYYELIVGTSEFSANKNIDINNDQIFLLLKNYYESFIKPHIKYYIEEFTSSMIDEDEVRIDICGYSNSTDVI